MRLALTNQSGKYKNREITLFDSASYKETLHQQNTYSKNFSEYVLYRIRTRWKLQALSISTNSVTLQISYTNKYWTNATLNCIKIK